MTLLLHPGFHKTATTWLQERVFSDRGVFRSLMGHAQIDELLVRPHDLDFDPAAASLRIEQLRSGTEGGLVDVISSEILTGNILFGARDSLTIADRLAATCRPARVLLTVRSQQGIAQSIYLQFVKRGGRLSIAEFFSRLPEPGYFGFDPRSLEFGRIAQLYGERFGQENVLVLPQELLRKDRGAFLQLLFDFAGADLSQADPGILTAPAAGKSPPASGVRLLCAANGMRDTPISPASKTVLTGLGNALQALGYRWKIGEEAASRRMKSEISAIDSG